MPNLGIKLFSNEVNQCKIIKTMVNRSSVRSWSVLAYFDYPLFFSFCIIQLKPAYAMFFKELYFETIYRWLTVI